MGYYINQNSKGHPLPNKGKADKLIEDGALEIPEPKEWKDGIVCVVNNGLFDAAGYAYSPRELEIFKDMSDGDNRKRRWLYYPLAAILSGYKANPLN